MNYFINFLLAISLTGFSYFFGGLLIGKDLAIWQALIIGFAVVSLGSLTEKLKAPMWLIILVPFPVGMFLLFLFLNQPITIWFTTYLLTLVIYTVFHMIMSYFFQFHSLIPAWKMNKAIK
ncbi:hypothetical protein [Halalkalibacter urbisdiaboli]|uniref:hypothetical protein n=1 Tax=Halalkalibacter urbisdiaboli TaxID=1960589 RepID=UPI000B43D2B2|nr:hypothetical protein [Halalkalibacter urbisdiaboli]